MASGGGKDVRKILSGPDPTAPGFMIKNLMPWEIEFCQEYISNGFIQWRAMLKAKPHISHRRARLDAIHVLKKPEIREYIRNQLTARVTRLSLSKDQVAMKYWEWANVDITDLVEIKERKKSKKVYLDVVLKKDIKDLPPEFRSAIKSITTTRDGKLKVELIDKKQSLDSMCKMLGLTEEQKFGIEAQQIVLNFDAQDSEA